MRVLRPLLLLLIVAAATFVGRGVASPMVDASTIGKQYLPIVIKNDPLRSPFLGFETNTDTIAEAQVAMQGERLNAKWVRLNSLSWRAIQPTQERAYNWGAAANFERELRAAFAARLTPVVVVDDHPDWATVAGNNCSAIKREHFDAFAAFMQELVLRYQSYPFNVHNWELGNEPDVDPKVFNNADSIFGCWGNERDQFYGGGHYGEMFKVVTPRIKQADPAARVWLGGLLLDSPATCTGVPSKPTCFFEGILRSNAAPFFDVVPYHAYASFNGNGSTDYSGGPGTPWGADGLAKGKARFLKQVMGRYQVSKPLFLNEAALRCPGNLGLCGAPPAAFFEAQANYVPRLVARTLSEGVEGVIWYTLNGPGWDNSGLLDGAQQPRPSYRAFQTLSDQTTGATGVPVQVNYGAGTEAYRFAVPGEFVDVVWSLDTVPETISVPADKFIAAYTWDGTPIVGRTFQVGFNAVYIHRRP